MTAIGVDGCPAGWFYVSEGEALEPFGIVPSLEVLVDRVPEDSALFVDIPIGLRDDDGRARGCDTLARRLLGRKRGSSVFPAPPHAVLGTEDYAAALQRSRAVTGKGLSMQTFRIAPKIREVDGLLRGGQRARAMIREVHPEVCFWAFAGGKSMKHRKKTREGIDERMEVLTSVMPESQDVVTAALAQFKRKELARDDIVDALVALATARSRPGNLHTLPDSPELDSQGLPMEMVFNCERVSGALLKEL